jgi:PrcB C-terminal
MIGRRWRAAVAAGAAVFVAVVVVQALWPEGKSEPVAWTELSAQFGPLPVTGETKRLFQRREQLERYLDRIGVDRAPPRVDFTRRQLLLVSPGPRSSSGYRLEVVHVRRRGGRIEVAVREHTPVLGERVEARVTYPYRLLSLPAGPEVFVDWLGR